jgi:ribosome-binding protein aMBF1 (putative translation factor)
MPTCNKCGKSVTSFGGEVYINGVRLEICQDCCNKVIEEKKSAKTAAEKGSGKPEKSSGSPIGIIIAVVIGWVLMGYFLHGCR